MKRRTFACPVSGCGNARGRWHAVCQSCWDRLPGDLRNRINTARAQRSVRLEANASIDASNWLTEHPPGWNVARVMGEAGAAPP